MLCGTLSSMPSAMLCGTQPSALPTEPKSPSQGGEGRAQELVQIQQVGDLTLGELGQVDLVGCLVQGAVDVVQLIRWSFLGSQRPRLECGGWKADAHCLGEALGRKGRLG